MVFGGPFDQWQDRYSTREDAERGHARAVAMALGSVADLEEALEALDP